MPRNMSFSLTKEQVLKKTKTVTRRQGWDKLKIGEIVQPVEKCMGFKRKRLGGRIRITSFSKELIENASHADLVREGFTNYTVPEYVDMYCKANGCQPTDTCNLIEFEYL